MSVVIVRTRIYNITLAEHHDIDRRSTGSLTTIGHPLTRNLSLDNSDPHNLYDSPE